MDEIVKMSGDGWPTIKYVTCSPVERSLPQHWKWRRYSPRSPPYHNIIYLLSDRLRQVGGFVCMMESVSWSKVLMYSFNPQFQLYKPFFSHLSKAPPTVVPASSRDARSMSLSHHLRPCTIYAIHVHRAAEAIERNYTGLWTITLYHYFRDLIAPNRI